jgi:hypothetical protein
MPFARNAALPLHRKLVSGNTSSSFGSGKTSFEPLRAFFQIIGYAICRRLLFTTSSGSRGVPETLAYSAGVISSNVSNRGTRSITSFAAPFNPVPSV